MSVAKLRASSTPDAMKSEEGNDSLDTFIRQATGKEPFISSPRTGDNRVQWIQLLQDLPGWPLLTPVKIQMQKCDKCSREFCSPINYRRHIRVHRRSFNVDKESHKNRNLLGAFWDKLSLDDAKEIVSFEDVVLEEVPGSSIIRALASFICKTGFCALPQVYVKAGSALLDIIQARPSRLPISSPELFSILDDASERTFLCAGAAESMQKYVFDGEAGKIGLEMKNLVACTCFLVEQKLVKAWLADKDAEALRCQKLLVEEEEAAQKRQAELLERKRQKKLRQKEQKAKEQSNGERAGLYVSADLLESPPSAEASSPPVPSEPNPHTFDIPADHVLSNLESVQFSNKENDADNEVQFGFSSEYSDSNSVKNVEPPTLQENDHQPLVITQWQVPKLQRGGRNGFHAVQNLQVLKLKPAQNHGPIRDLRSAPVNGGKVWTRKPKAGNGESLRTRILKVAINQTDQINCEVMIGSISVPVRNCASQQQDNCLAEPQDNCSTEHTMAKKNNVQEKQMKLDSVQCVTNRATVKLWKPVSRHETRGPLPVQSGNRESEEGATLGKGDVRTLPSESCLGSCAMDNNDSECLEENVEPEGVLFSSSTAKAFLAQRWKEAISVDHVKLVLYPEPEPPGCPDAGNDCPGAAPASDFQEVSILESVENRVVKMGATTVNANPNLRMTHDEDVKIKYIPKQKTVA